MAKTKQTARGASSSHRPGGMATARFAGAEEDEPQFKDTPGEEETGASKSTGKAGDQPQQVEGGPEVPPEENPPPPVNPTPDTSKDPTPGTSKDPTDAPPTVPAQDPTQDPTETKAEEVEVETPPELTTYVKSYKLAGKNWLDTVLGQKEQAYDTLYDRLVMIGTKHKENLDQAVKAQVFASIKDRSGKCLSEDGRSQNTVPIASTQVAIKGIVQYSTRTVTDSHRQSRTVSD